ncbi:MAG TPA: InlB B-repeat-containing protein, partial [Clostridia bacterium]|nr:InlB B-repeat-containing protein [Clostridia bacterium]
MKKSKRSLSLILMLVLVLVLSVAVLAGCNGLQVPTENPIDIGGDKTPGGDNTGKEPAVVNKISPTVEPLAYNVKNSDESQLLNCDEYILFDVSSELVITNGNIGSFVEVIDRDGVAVAIEVIAHDGIYTIAKAEGVYTAGATYTIELLDTGANFTGKDAALREITFTIFKDAIADQVFQNGIVVVQPTTVSILSVGEIDSAAGIYEIQLELVVPYDVSNLDEANARFAVDNVFVIAESIETVTAESTFGRIVANAARRIFQSQNRVICFIQYESPSLEEIYEILNIYTIEEVDCSEIAIDEEIVEGITASIRESQMFYDFAEAIYLASDEAASAGIKDTVTGFLDNFKILTEIKHEGRGFALAFSIEYLSDADTNGKCMYAKVAYGGVVTYDVKAYAELDGTKFYYDFALIVNTQHTLTISVQWIDSETDTIVTNDEELAAKVSGILADRTLLDGVIFGGAKAVSKEFSVPLIKTLTYVIPNTPITINLDLNWFISFSVQAELFNETVITTSDTIGVRSVKDAETGKLVPEKYHARTNSITNDTMLFGTLTIATGVNADAYFSIVGFAKWLRVGFDARVGVYLELDGVFAKTAASDDNIKTAAGEFGYFVSIALEYKVFVLSGKPLGYEFHGTIVTFGQDIITLGWDNEKVDTTIELELVTPISIDGQLSMKEMDLPAYESDKAYLTFQNPIELDTVWATSEKVYSVNDFEYDFAQVDGKPVATYANGSIVVLSKDSFTTTMTMTLKADSGVSKVFTISYTAPVIVIDDVPEASYNVSFNSKGGSYVAPITVDYLGTTTLATPTKQYYVFNGWQLNGVAVKNEFTMTVASNVVLEAKWTQAKADYTYISTAAQLRAVANNLSGKYFLLNNINLGGAEWNPIGTAEAPFTGIFDGNGFKVYGFKVTKATSYAGLFGYVKLVGASYTEKNIMNLTVENATISFTAEKTNVYAGVIAGVNEGEIKNAIVRSSSVAITMKGDVINKYKAYVGGFVGVNKKAISGACSTSAKVSAVSANSYISLYVGGFAALNEGNIAGTASATASATGTPTAKSTAVVDFCETYSAGFVAINAENAKISGASVYGNYT